MNPLHPEDLLNPGPTTRDPLHEPASQRDAAEGFVSVNGTHAHTPVGTPPRRRPSGPESVNPTR